MILVDQAILILSLRNNFHTEVSMDVSILLGFNHDMNSLTSNYIYCDLPNSPFILLFPNIPTWRHLQTLVSPTLYNSSMHLVSFDMRMERGESIRWRSKLAGYFSYSCAPLTPRHEQ